MKRHYSFILHGLCVVFIIGFLTQIGCQKSKESASKVPFKIVAILAMSGRADFIGKPEAAVLKILTKQINESGGIKGKPIEIIYENSEGDTERAIKLFDKATSDPEVLAVIGPSTSGESLAIASKADQAQIPLLSLAASADIVRDRDNNGNTRPYVFKFAQNDDLAAGRLIHVISELGLRKIALLYSNDGFGKSGSKSFRQHAAKGIISITHDTSFPPQETTLEPFALAVPKNLDGIVIWGTAPGPQLLVQNLRRTHGNTKIFLSHGNASTEFIRQAGATANGVILLGSKVLLSDSEIDPQDPQKEVVQQYKQMWQANQAGPISNFGGYARDALAAVVEVLQTGATSRKALRDGLEVLRNFKGVAGIFSFSPTDHAGLDDSSFTVLIVSAGIFKPFKL